MVNTILHFYLICTVCFKCIQSTLQSGGYVTVYEHEFYKGYRKRFHLVRNQCLNLNEIWNDDVSSIDPGDMCLILWIDHKCKGKAVRLIKHGFGADKLANVHMNDAVSSFNLC